MTSLAGMLLHLLEGFLAVPALSYFLWSQRVLLLRAVCACVSTSIDVSVCGLSNRVWLVYDCWFQGQSLCDVGLWLNAIAWEFTEYIAIHACFDCKQEPSLVPGHVHALQEPGLKRKLLELWFCRWLKRSVHRWRTVSWCRFRAIPVHLCTVGGNW